MNLSPNLIALGSRIAHINILHLINSLPTTNRSLISPAFRAGTPLLYRSIIVNIQIGFEAGCPSFLLRQTHADSEASEAKPCSTTVLTMFANSTVRKKLVVGVLPSPIKL
jgi:hypothetical protein